MAATSRGVGPTEVYLSGHPTLTASAPVGQTAVPRGVAPDGFLGLGTTKPRNSESGPRLLETRQVADGGRRSPDRPRPS